ncbi:MAG: MarR family transcriptional regulator [Acidimicrobiia bacterium]
MTQPDIQLQARALGDPTRHTIFRLIAQRGGGIDVARLTAELGLNHNAIRQHLGKLVDAGLVARRPAPVTGRGRPRQLYELHPTIDSRWEAGGPYQRLSLLLVEIIRSGDAPVEVGRRAGRVAELRTRPDDNVAAALGRAMAGEGFDPTLKEDDGELIKFELRTCPFAETAVADPETICSLHLGLAQGLAEQFDGLAVESLEPRDPREAGCLLRFHSGSGGGLKRPGDKGGGQQDDGCRHHSPGCVTGGAKS